MNSFPTSLFSVAFRPRRRSKEIVNGQFSNLDFYLFIFHAKKRGLKDERGKWASGNDRDRAETRLR